MSFTFTSLLIKILYTTYECQFYFSFTLLGWMLIDFSLLLFWVVLIFFIYVKGIWWAGTLVVSRGQTKAGYRVWKVIIVHLRPIDIHRPSSCGMMLSSSALSVDIRYPNNLHEIVPKGTIPLMKWYFHDDRTIYIL